MRFEKVVDGLADQAEVAICDHFLRVFADSSEIFFHLQKDGFVFQVFEAENTFYACFSVY